uniref:DNA-directed DNA polymerase n=1 Tax=Phanerochaete carnosa TaxID=231932 RepID=A0A895KWT2_9APHY|nr:DNA polymerase type B [Phanerochaete carnosa]QRZ60388.1 DNA polymerase type B [Phanerochaete carnosa]
MVQLPVPIGKPVAFEGNIKNIDPNAYGFFYCKITSPEYLKHPFLQRRIKTADGIRTVAGLGSWVGWVFSGEYETALELGYKIEIIRGYKFKTGYIFKEYVEKMYNLRRQYSKDNPMNMIAKLLMNSLYAAKPGMRSDLLKVDIIKNERVLSDKYLGDHQFTIQDSFEVGDYILFLRKNVSKYCPEDESEHNYALDVNVSIAAAITAGGRIFMRLRRLKTIKILICITPIQIRSLSIDHLEKV